MSAPLDLTHLTPDEIEHVRSVMNRAKEVENTSNEKPRPTEAPGNMTSHEVFQSTWKEKHGMAGGDYQTGIDVVSAALNDKNPGEIQEHLSTPRDSRKSSVSSNQEVTSQTNSKNGSKNDLSQADATSVTSAKSGGSTSNESPKSGSAKRVQFVKPTIALDGKPLDENGTNDAEEEDRDILSPLPNNTPSSPKHYDTKSMVSRSSMHPHDFVGELNITLIYYPPTNVQLQNLPTARSTRLPDDETTDIMTRKTYAALSGAKIRVVKDSKTGAKPDDDGELHLMVEGAYDLRLPSGMSRKARTYAKCYMLPDRYHGSKMRSSIVKDSLNPRYNHKFVFRGFSLEEFNERAVELIIGGIISARGRHLVVGGIRLSSGKQTPDQPAVLWKNSNDEESILWNEAFEKPCTEVTGSVPLRPRIKLTYK